MAQCLEALRHEVIVADPNDAPMDPERRRRVKTNRRDARTLATACRLGAYIGDRLIEPLLHGFGSTPAGRRCRLAGP